MMMQEQIILLYAGAYRMIDEKTGEVNEGVSVSYYFNVNLDTIDNENGTVGMRPAKCSCPVDCIKKIVKAPALYEAAFEMNVGSDGKAVLKIRDLKYVSPIEMRPVKEKVEKVEKAG